MGNATCWMEAKFTSNINARDVKASFDGIGFSFASELEYENQDSSFRIQCYDAGANEEGFVFEIANFIAANTAEGVEFEINAGEMIFGIGDSNGYFEYSYRFVTEDGHPELKNTQQIGDNINAGGFEFLIQGVFDKYNHNAEIINILKPHFNTFDWRGPEIGDEIVRWIIELANKSSNVDDDYFKVSFVVFQKLFMERAFSEKQLTQVLNINKIQVLKSFVDDEYSVPVTAPSLKKLEFSLQKLHRKSLFGAVIAHKRLAFEAANTATSPKRLDILAKKSLELTQIVASNECTPISTLIALALHKDVRVRLNVALNCSLPSASRTPLLRDFSSSGHPEIRRRVAQARFTPEEICRILLHDNDWSVVADLIDNPTTSRELLKEISRLYYSNLENSVDTSDAELILEHLSENPKIGPEILEKLATSALHPFYSVLNNPLVTSDTINLLVETNEDDENCTKFSAQHPMVSEDTLDFLSTNGSPYSLSSVLSNPRLPTLLAEWLAMNMASDENSIVREGVSGSEAAPVEILKLLSKDKDRYVRAHIVKNPSAPISALKQLAKDKVRDIRMELALRPSLPVPVLTLLAKDNYNVVRQRAAENPLMPVSTLERLATDEDPGVRSSAAKNPSLPASTLERLALDVESLVRSSVAGNPLTPTPLLEKLALDNGSYVSARTAGNPSTPVFVLEGLARHEDEYTRQCVADNPSSPIYILEFLAQDVKNTVRKSVAKNSSAPILALEWLALDDDKNIRWEVAGNSSTPSSVLALLAADEDSFVREYTAKNRSTPEPILEQLAVDEERDVRISLAKNQPTSAAVLELLAMDEDRVVRQYVAENTSTSVSALEWLAIDEEKSVREHAVKNPSLPAPIFYHLKEDSNLQIRRHNADLVDAPSGAIGSQANQNIMRKVLAEDFVHSDYLEFFQWWQNTLPEEDRLLFLNRLGAASGYSVNAVDFSEKTKTIEGSILEFSKVIGPCWAEYKANGVSNWAQMYNSKEETRDISYKILDYAETLVPKSNIVDRHFYLQNRIQTYYRWRNLDKFALGEAILACKASVSISKQAANEFLTEGQNLPEHHGFKQLAIIEEKAGNFMGVIEICRVAEAQGWNGDWQKRLQRIERKRN